LEMAKSADLAQQGYGELYAEQQAQAEAGAPASMWGADQLIEEGGWRSEDEEPAFLLNRRVGDDGMIEGMELGGKSSEPGALMAALQTIADIEASDPGGRKSWKEFVVEARAIAREAITGVDEAASVWDGEIVAALREIAGIETIEQEGRRL